MTKYRIGDIVAIQKTDFPMSLRNGPGYSHDYICVMQPKELAIVLGNSIGHSAITWVQLLIASNSKVGWIPETVLIKT